MRRGVHFASVLIAAGLSASAASEAVPRNIVIMISDGWGYNQLDAVAYWNGERAVYEKDRGWHRMGMSTYMVLMGGESRPYGGDDFTGVYGYHPDRAWSDWFEMQNYATDSAAAATAMSTGVKTRKGAIGLDPEGNRLRHLVEWADEKGKATGLVTSVQLSHGTPAGYSAHNVSRDHYDEIAREMIEDSGLDLIMGAGHPDYDNDGRYLAPEPERPWRWICVGGPETWQALREGRAGAPEPWTLIESREEFESLALDSDPPARVLGVARAADTLQEQRSGSAPYNDPEPPYTRPFNEGVPSLDVMALGALNVLSRDEDGFVLMVEGGAVDWAGHGRVLGRLIEEQNDFNAACEAVLQWLGDRGETGSTLLVVTGDHETGFLWGEGVLADKPETWFTPVQDRGPGVMPGFRFYSEPGGPEADAGHSNSLIPLFARGPGAERLANMARGRDPVRGPYLDNTDLAKVLIELLD